MTAVALVSAKGSPGVTTTTLAFTAVASSPLHAARCAPSVLVEADPVGGDLECWCGPLGEAGLAGVATSNREAAYELLGVHAVEVVPCVRAVTAPTGSAPMTTMLRSGIGALAEALTGWPGTAFVDVGRCDPSSEAGLSELLEAVDVLVVVCRPSLASVEHVRSLVDRRPAAHSDVAVVVVGGDRPYGPSDIASALAARARGGNRSVSPTDGHDGENSARRLEGELRRIVAAEVTEQCRQAEKAGRPLEAMDQRQVARAVLQRELERHERQALRLGELPLPAGDREALSDRVLAQVFSPLPGLERYLDDDQATNIHVLGSREVIVERLDGTCERFPSPFDSDQQVIDMVAHIARRGGTVEKEFNFSHPLLHLSLPDGSRLTAHAWISPEPHVTIRRHPLVDYDLDDLAGLGMFDPGLRSLLGAAVRAKWNILVAGAQGAGKTTLLRALAHEEHPDARLVVMESEPELGLDRLPHRHNHVVAVAERPGNMAGEGAVLLDTLGWHGKRLSPGRIIVGEVLADEVVPMLEAMTQGVPAMGTIHAESSRAVLPRLPVYARARGRDWRSGDIFALAAVALDLIVFVARDKTDRRVVAEVRHIDRYDHETEQVISDAWFLPDPVTKRAEPASVIPVPLLDELVTHGYRPRPPANGAATPAGNRQPSRVDAGFGAAS